jgi:hypothetical protein
VPRQVLGSIVVAIAIVAVTIAIVTAKLGPNAEDDHGGKGKTEQSDKSGKDD